MSDIYSEMKVREMVDSDIPDWQRGATNFRSKLFGLISQADSVNRHRLSKAFPLESEAFRRWEQRSRNGE